jgi:ABC-2 type transport system permease protein
LWEITFRSQYAIMLGTLEELWSRNMAQLFSTPLRPGEYLIGMVIFRFLRTTLIIALCALFVRVAFGFSVFDLGWALLAFYFLLLMTGWWTGIMLCGLLFRYGLTVEWMVWMAAFILQPLAGVFYPVTVLPVWLQPVSWMLPPTYAFEGMRAVLQQGVVRYDLLLASLALNLIYLALACWLFLRAFERARQHGSLLNGSE